MHPSIDLENEHLLSVVQWHDAHIETSGFAVDDPYIEMFWLPILGPTATWLLRRMASGLAHQPQGYTIDMNDVARSIGVAYSSGRHNPFARALHRCVMFGVAQQIAVAPLRTVAVRTHVPKIPLRHLSRLPEQLVIAHHDWIHASAS